MQIDYLLIIAFTAIWFITGIYMSHVVCQAYDKIWHSPFDIVLFWKMARKTENKYHKWLFIINISSFFIALTLAIILM